MNVSIRIPKLKLSRMSPGDVVFDLFLVIFMIFLIAITLYPILYALFASISDPQRLIQHRGILVWPLGFSLASYKLVFQNPQLFTTMADGDYDTADEAFAAIAERLAQTLLAAQE